MAVTITPWVLSSRDATIVELEYSDGNDWFTVHGTARRHPNDADDQQLALTLAYGRAFDTLGKKLIKRANVRTADNDYRAAQIRRRKEEAAAEAERQAKKAARVKLKTAGKVSTRKLAGRK